jgi:RecA/RadA recombinase|tara:strand:+ start:3639 stop:4805 length:1167 start_codon:yes stop_codon:yes gene_type:complete
MSKFNDKEIDKALDSIDKINPFATYLEDSTLSRVGGWIDTGSYVLNAIVSGSIHGGIPKGRVTMMGGESMTGKTLFVLKILANAQKEGLIPVIFDTENAVDPEGAERIGLDISKVKYVPCITIEQTRNALFKFLTAVKEKGLEGKFIIAIDSLGNLQSELEHSRMGKDSMSSDMGTKARAMKSLMQTCTNLGATTQTTILCTNHVYDDPTAMFPSIEKNMPGGKSIIYLPSVTIQLARKPMKSDGGKTMDAETAVGQKNYAGILIRALTRKNRFIKQYLQGEMFLSFHTGLDRYYGLLDLAVGVGAVIQTGSTYQLPDGKKIGYYKNFRKDKDLWENTILPVLEERIKKEWAYSSGDEEGEVPDEVEEADETPQAPTSLIMEDIENTN